MHETSGSTTLGSCCVTHSLCPHQVEVQDITDVTCCFTVAGPGSKALVAQLGAGQLAGQPFGSHVLFGSRGGQPVTVSVGSGLDQPGFTLITGQDVAAELWQHLVRLVGVPCCICSVVTEMEKSPDGCVLDRLDYGEPDQPGKVWRLACRVQCRWASAAGSVRASWPGGPVLTES